MKRWLAIAFVTLCLGGCATLDAMKADMGFNTKTGQLDAEVKGAGPGGQFNENTGLNLTSGDNTVPAMAVAGLLGVAIIFAYPLQRSLRRRREQEVLREWEDREKPKTKRKRKRKKPSTS